MERRYTILAIAVPPMLLAAFVLGFFLRGQAEGQEALGAKVRETARVIQERYYGEVADEKLEHAILDGMMNALDPYCQYFTKQEYEDFHSKAMSGNFFGVGIVVEEDRETGYVTVVTPLEDTPAFQADILPGDKMIKINGEDIKGQNLNDVVRKIKGEEGTKVTITLARRGREPFDVTLTRAQITIVAVKHKMLDERIGYVRISDFTEMLPQFDKAIADLRSKGMKGIVIDLRFNGGGLLDSAVELADRFLPKGKLIVSTKGRLRGDRREVMSEDGENDVIDVPVVILTNSGTASASEIFAGCLRDHGRGVIVGARTYGKGSVQTPIPLADGSRVKITTARYFTPNGTSVHREEGKKTYGLDPDHLVELTDQENAEVLKHWRQEGILKKDPEAKPPAPKDLQLEAALEVLNARLDGRPARVESRDLSAVKKEHQEQ